MRSGKEENMNCFWRLVFLYFLPQNAAQTFLVEICIRGIMLRKISIGLPTFSRTPWRKVYPHVCFGLLSPFLTWRLLHTSAFPIPASSFAIDKPFCTSSERQTLTQHPSDRIFRYFLTAGITTLLTHYLASVLIAHKS